MFSLSMAGFMVVLLPKVPFTPLATTCIFDVGPADIGTCQPIFFLLNRRTYRIFSCALVAPQRTSHISMALHNAPKRSTYSPSVGALY